MKLVIEVEVPESATFIEKQDAMLHVIQNESWKEIKTREELRIHTDLNNKCGSCKFFTATNGCYGRCENGRTYGQRSRRACKKYEVRND